LKKLLILAIMALTLLIPTAVMAADVALDTKVLAPTVVFSIVDVTEGSYISAMDFGDVIAGRDSDIQTFKIRNDGTGSIVVKISTAHTFYQLRMTLSSGAGWETYPGGSGWTTPAIDGTLTVPPGTALTLSAKVHPLNADVGTQPGTLTFLAELAP
jgi:hypothetical protein